MSAALWNGLAIFLGFLLDGIFSGSEEECRLNGIICAAENFLRRCSGRTHADKAAGALLWVLVCGVSFAAPFALLYLTSRVSRWLAFAMQVVFCWQIFSRGQLAEAGARVQEALGSSLEEGRRAAARYVPCDTEACGEEEVIRVTIEMIAGDTTRRVVAPIMFLLLGGVPLGFLYRAADMLCDHVKTEPLGWFSAWMERLLCFLPARAAAVCMVAGAGMLKFDARNARRVFQCDCIQKRGSNAAQTQAVCAGALHIQLGGFRLRSGEAVPLLGDYDRTPVKSDIGRATDLMTTASVFALTLGFLLRLAVG